MTEVNAAGGTGEPGSYRLLLNSASSSLPAGRDGDWLCETRFSLFLKISRKLSVRHANTNEVKNYVPTKIRE